MPRRNNRNRRNRASNSGAGALARLPIYTQIVETANRQASTTAGAFLTAFNEPLNVLVNSFASTTNRTVRPREFVVEFAPLAVFSGVTPSYLISAQLLFYDPRTTNFTAGCTVTQLSVTNKTVLKCVVPLEAAAFYGVSNGTTVLRINLYNNLTASAAAVYVPYVVYTKLDMSLDVPTAAQ